LRKTQKAREYLRKFKPESKNKSKTLAKIRLGKLKFSRLGKSQNANASCLRHCFRLAARYVPKINVTRAFWASLISKNGLNFLAMRA